MKKRLIVLSGISFLLVLMSVYGMLSQVSNWFYLGYGVVCLSLVYTLKSLFAWQEAFHLLAVRQQANPVSFIADKQSDLKAFAKDYWQVKRQLAALSLEKETMSEHLEALLSHLTMGMFLVSKDRTVLLQSQSLPSYFPKTKHPIRMLADIRRMDVRALINEAFDKKKMIKKELAGLDDNDLILEVSAIPILTNRDQVTQVLVLLYDLTTIRSYEKSNMDFISNASHELRTPVTSIKGFAETLKEMPETESKTKEEFLEIIYNESLRLERIVEHMLTLSKAAKIQIQTSRFLINDFLTYIGQSMTPQLSQKKLHLHYQLAGDCVVQTDKYVLSQILLNLLSNAIRYTDQGGTIKIKTQWLNEELKITVSDTGIGIKTHELERIFERFYRVNKGRSRQSGGTGLGLAIVKELSDLLGATIQVDSQLGQGSDFTITLPKQMIAEPPSSKA